jgi:hypothetical protein
MGSPQGAAQISPALTPGHPVSGAENSVTDKIEGTLNET